MGKLTTHILDTASGKPGSGIGVKLFSMANGRHLVASAVTNADGRTDDPLLEGETFQAGTYELEFSVGPYFRESGAVAAEPPFLDDVVIRVTLSGEDHYHVPLLVSPWSYSTYRGS
jgi:5-hydroxyisourate hydrolase